MSQTDTAVIAFCAGLAVAAVLLVGVLLTATREARRDAAATARKPGVEKVEDAMLGDYVLRCDEGNPFNPLRVRVLEARNGWVRFRYVHRWGLGPEDRAASVKDFRRTFAPLCTPRSTSVPPVQETPQ